MGGAVGLIRARFAVVWVLRQVVQQIWPEYLSVQVLCRYAGFQECRPLRLHKSQRAA